jgi:hypothetical protein
MDIDDLIKFPKSRKEAIKKLSKFYFTGKNCANGHLNKRSAKTGKCATCDIEHSKKYREKNPEKVKKSLKEYYEKNKDFCILLQKNRYLNNKEKIDAYKKEYDEKNKDLIKEKKKKYAEKNKERFKVLNQEWYLKNKDKKKNTDLSWRNRNKERVKENRINAKRRRRARQKSSEGTFTKKQCNELLIKQNNKCVYCNSDIKSKHEADHIMPISLGGSNDIKNIQMLCCKCNRSKGAKTHDEFIKFLHKQKSV